MVEEIFHPKINNKYHLRALYYVLNGKISNEPFKDLNLYQIQQKIKMEPKLAFSSRTHQREQIHTRRHVPVTTN